MNIREATENDFDAIWPIFIEKEFPTHFRLSTSGQSVFM